MPGPKCIGSEHIFQGGIRCPVKVLFLPSLLALILASISAPIISRAKYECFIGSTHWDHSHVSIGYQISTDIHSITFIAFLWYKWIKSVEIFLLTCIVFWVLSWLVFCLLAGAENYKFGCHGEWWQIRADVGWQVEKNLKFCVSIANYSFSIWHASCRGGRQHAKYQDWIWQGEHLRHQFGETCRGMGFPAEIFILQPDLKFFFYLARSTIFRCHD